MMRTLALLLTAVLASIASAAEPRVTRDIPYAEPANPRQMLDVYAPAEGKDLPVIVWIHGGGWRRGDKASVQLKPAAFNERGFLFVSTTYRFVPEVTVKEMTGDVARDPLDSRPCRGVRRRRQADHRHGPLGRRSLGRTRLHGWELLEGERFIARHPQGVRADRRFDV